MAVLIIHAMATWLMVGLIWTIQAVHYPLFNLVGSAGFASYESAHTTRMGRLLVIPALSEVVTGIALLWARPPGIGLAAPVLGVVLLGMIWATTAVVQVPLHGFLSRRFDPAAIRQLVRTNWIRTSLWSVRGVLVALLLVM